MPPGGEEPDRITGSQQSFHQCKACRGRFVVVAPFELATDPRDLNVMCPHCGKANSIAVNGRLRGKVEVRKERA